MLIPALAPAVNAAEIAWSSDTPLTTNPATDWNGQIIQADGTIWVVWASNRAGNYDIFYNISSDGGATWSSETPLTTYQYNDDYPSIMQTANGSIWVVWAREIMGPPYQWDLYYKISSDGGDTWSEEKLLTTDPNNDLTPSIIQTADDKIWVVWQSNRIKVQDPWTGEWIDQDDIFYKTSSDGGATWSNYTRLTTDPKDDIDPSITQTADDKIWVAWVSDRYDGRDIFYKTSSDGGAKWSDDIQLTEYVGDDRAPSITQTINGTIWVVWHSEREGNYDIYYKTSSDGVTWSAETPLTTDPNFDGAPSITQTADGEIWIVWTSNRAENYDIWYTTSTVAVHDVAVLNITRSSTWVYRGRTVAVTVKAKNEGSVKETFNVTAYANTTVIGTQRVIKLAPNATTTLTFNWNTTNILLGNYTISATAGPVEDETDLTDNSLSDGTIDIRILLGDLDGDGDVDSDDFVLFAGAYGSRVGNPGYNLDADLDGDGDVDWEDFVLFAGAYEGPSYNLDADLDGDGDVDWEDFVLFAGAYGSRVGNPGYNLDADLDGDGDVDWEDFVLFAGAYGKRGP